MCTVIDLLRVLIEEERVLIKIEFNRATIMFVLLRASIELVRTNCPLIAHLFQLRCTINIWVSVNVAFDIFLILFSFLVYT